MSNLYKSLIKMSDLHSSVYNDCVKILNIKYKWIESRHPGQTYPKFKIPEDPTDDIKNILKWKNIVDKESKGTDPGEDAYAYQFKDFGFKVYLTNANVLSYLKDNKHQFIEENNITEEIYNTSMKRWKNLENICYECNKMLRKLRYND